MEALLKKSKITKSLLNQTEIASIEDIEKLDILGWCKEVTAKYNYNWIVLYDNKKGVLKKYILFDYLKERDYEYQSPNTDSPTRTNFVLSIHTRSLAEKEFKSNDKEEIALYRRYFTALKSQALSIGQFYI